MSPAPALRAAAAHRARLRERDYAHQVRWLALAVLCATLAMISLDNTILNVALPTLHAAPAAGGVGASTSQLQWINDGYIIVFAGLLLTMGSLGDRFGRARHLALGLTIFGAGSLLSAGAGSAGTLIAGRCVMGLAAACIMPATLSILSNVFVDTRERRVAIGIWSGVSAVGSVTGPVTGGLLLRHFWWGAIFLVNVPVVAITLAMAFRYVPNSRDPVARRLDPLGAALSVLALVALLWGIIEAPSRGWLSGGILGAFAAAAVLVAAFVRWELRSRAPMLDLGFFRNPGFSVASLAIALTFFGMYGTSFLLTQYLQEMHGLTALAAGAAVAPNAIVFFVTATRVATPLVERAGSRAVLTGGLASLAMSMALMALVTDATPLLDVVAITCLTGIGMGLILGPATASIMASIPRERAGVGSAMNDTTRQVGGALGVAVLGTILYSHHPAGAPGSLTLGGLHAATLTAAVVVGCAIPPVLRYLPGRGREEHLAAAPAAAMEPAPQASAAVRLPR